MSVRASEFQTEYASRAYIVANVFNKKFEHVQFTGKSPRVVLVMPSLEQSTEGGKLARNTITLKAYTGTQSPPLSGGWFDVGSNAALLNSYEAVYDAHLKRNGKAPFELDREEYDGFLAAARKFLEGEGFTVTLKAGQASPPTSSGSGLGLVIAVLGVAALVGAAAAFFFLR